LSADTIVPDPGNPQSLNRYAYVYNNPVGYVDPTGHVRRGPWIDGYSVEYLLSGQPANTTGLVTGASIDWDAEPPVVRQSGTRGDSPDDTSRPFREAVDRVADELAEKIGAGAPFPIPLPVSEWGSEDLWGLNPLEYSADCNSRVQVGGDDFVVMTDGIQVGGLKFDWLGGVATSVSSGDIRGDWYACHAFAKYRAPLIWFTGAEYSLSVGTSCSYFGEEQSVTVSSYCTVHGRFRPESAVKVGVPVAVLLVAPYAAPAVRSWIEWLLPGTDLGKAVQGGY